MKVTRNDLANNTIELTIEVSPHDVQPHLERAAERISRERPVPGFRPGKASYAVMEKAVGADVLYHEAAESVIRATFPKVVAEHKLETVGAPKIELQKIAPKNPLIYKATVALLPKVELGDYRSLRVAKNAIVVEEKEIDTVLEELRDSRSTEALVARPAQLGDRVEIDFTGSINNVPVEGASSSNHPLVLGSKQFVPGFEEELVGLAAKGEKTFTVRFPKDYHQKSLSDKDVSFHVTMRSVYERTKPALDDAFAQQLGSYKTVAELRKRIHSNLEEQHRHKERERFELAMLEAIAQLSTFGDFPDMLLDGEIDTMLQELQHSVEERGMEFAKYLESIKKSVDDLRTEFRPKAEQRVRMALLSRAIAAKEHIEVSDDEVAKEIEATRALYEGNETVEQNLRTPEYARYLKNTLTQKRVFELLDELIGQNEGAEKK